ncbi:PQQ-dependent sugar dehydrogenase [Halomarina oriensis]|uniref:PQQ-dependent sugar dehydrogenase n=1 Tax=Halomarina oriensis TaxID=671145 RepID=A0A6B0GK48_9EURY|nr:PQQ-dependent sugar dehydrogenase [Halomarina oriensis]MWG34251.1 PQQ-dependent sugar dehydrogenase [Halomarina oriensis]
MDRRTFLRVVGTGALGTVTGVAGCLQSDPPTAEGGTATTTADDGQRVVAETVASDLEVPWGVAWPGDDPADLFLTERPGRVVHLADGETTVVAEPEGTGTRGEGGLMGLAFHPDDASVAFTVQTYEDGGTKNRVLRHAVDDDWASEPMFEDIPGARYHDGGRLLVHDDTLYVTAGDATDADLAQDPETLNGSVLGLTFDGEPHPENPDVGHPAVFTYGHRNPQGLAVGADGESLYQTEHGPDTDDEVNRLRAGENYGWPVVRGVESGEDDRFVPALSSYTPTIAPGGLARYPDDGGVTAWQGDFFFGTLSGTHLHRVRLDGSDDVTLDERLFDGEFGRLRTTIVGPDGHLYATTSNRDGRGSPGDGDDRLLRFRPEGE